MTASECIVENGLTGVRSLDPSSSVALVAASIRSSQRFPNIAAALGSAETAFLSPPLLRFANSLLLLRSCLARRACCVKLLFRGLLWLLDIERCSGGRVVGLRSDGGGERAMELGSKPGW